MTVRIGALEFGNEAPLGLIAGPCVIESEEHVLRMATAIRDAVGAYVFKASFDKANRSSVRSYRGPGMDEGLRILGKVRQLGIPVLTDIHEAGQAGEAAASVDILQIPAFLCRQTDLLVEAGRTGRAVNIKKGQFVSPLEIAKAAEKVASTGNQQILLTERGSSFGYNNLVVDMRGLRIACSCRGRLARGRADSRSLLNRWRGPRARSGWREFLWKRMTIRRALCRMGRMRCRWGRWQVCGSGCGGSTGW